MADVNAVKEKPDELDTPKPGEESAPSEDGGGAGGQVETPENEPNESGKPGHYIPGGVVQDLRRDRRLLRQQVETLQKQVQELTSSRSPQPKPRAEDSEGSRKETPSFFEDPDGHLAAREQTLRAQVLKDIMSISEKQEALKLIRSQNGFGDGDEDAFADLMQEHGLDVLAQTQPVKAARLAIRLWAEEKGIKPVSRESKAKAGSVRGGAPSGGPKKITLSHIRELQTRLSKGENVDKELAEAWAAAKEGRIIED
jgi:hypothetical protein